MNSYKEFCLPFKLFSLVIPFLLISTANADTGSACRTDYPIVLSHFWGVEKICSDTPSEECDRLQPAKYCADWQWDAQGRDYDCMEWRVPDDELSLPPRNTNSYDPSLMRDLSEYHRYFSREIIEKLEQQCDVAVFVSDKPIYASYEVRAKSLRNTVLQALNETGAEKVNLIGMSQGSQDARYLAAKLPVNDTDPSLGMMKDKVASVVTVVGEDEGAESATLYLSVAYLTNVLGGAGWGDFSKDAFWPSAYDNMLTGVWALNRGAAEQKYVLIERYDKENVQEYDLDQNQFYRTYLQSFANLSEKYMQGSEGDGQGWEEEWVALHDYFGTDKKFWSDEIAAEDEKDNGVQYYSYAAQIQSWNSKDWGLTSQAAISYFYIKTVEGLNDGFVSVKSQKLDNRGYNNFRHVKTMKGSPLGRGYFHSYFTGRNDRIYAPKLKLLREPAPFDGGSADFFAQVAVFLASQGF